MSARPDSAAPPRLHRALGTLDLVLMNLAAIIGLRWISVAAQLGPSSLILWVLAALTFLIPSALTVVELGSRMPGEGGFYLWSKAAFGEMHGFIAGWSYWISNLVFFPSLLLYAAGVILYVPGGHWLALRDNGPYNTVMSMAILWLATLLNIVGLERAKWLQNLGAIATWCAGAFMLVGGFIAFQRFGSATIFAPTTLVPDLAKRDTLIGFATIALGCSGLELGLILGDEIKEPRRTVPRAVFISGALVALIYIAGTASLLVALPAAQVNSISGIPQALAAIAGRLGEPLLGNAAALFVAIGATGALGAWITGTARLPFLFGIDRYLPRSLGAVHPRFGSPYAALVMQGVLSSLVLLCAVAGSAIREAYQVLVDMTVILALMPLLYMFAALPVLRLRRIGGEASLTLIPGGPIVAWLVALSGFAVTLAAVLFAMLPPEGAAHPMRFVLKVVGGTIGLMAVGLACFFRGRRS
jgi:amino acid transporter